jgi:hypothetical protein
MVIIFKSVFFIFLFVLGFCFLKFSIFSLFYLVHNSYVFLSCNNPNFWEIEINGFIKIQNFGDNKNFYFEYKINFLSFKTGEFEHLLPCFK